MIKSLYGIRYLSLYTFIIAGAKYDFISHMFDCIPMVGRYKIDNGQVEYSNKRFDCRDTRIWMHYGMNVSRSKVSWLTVFADIDVPAYLKIANKEFNETLLATPTVNFWKSGSRDPVFAVTESFFSPTALKTSPDLVVLGMYMNKFKDKGFPSSFRPGSGHAIINNPAHEQTDPDGTIWTSTLDLEYFSKTKMDNLEAAVVVYTINGTERTLAARHVLGKYNISSCSSLKQADLDVMPGYTHFIQTTSEHILVPQTSYRFDYCLDYNNRAKVVPGFLRSYAWHPEVNTSILIFERKNMTKVHHVYLPFAKFFTHDLNAYEDSTHVYLDTLAYDDASVYLTVPKLKSMLNDLPWKASVIRVAIDKRSWSYDAAKSGPLTETDPFGKAEFPVINYERKHQQDYTFAYFTTNALYRNAKITKLNVKTKKTIDWTPPFGYYPQEPIFVQPDDATGEDEGVVLCSGPVSNPPGTSFLAILNATDLSQIALIKNPNAAPMGLHNRFYKRKKANIDTSSGVSSGASWLFCISVMLAKVVLC